MIVRSVGGVGEEERETWNTDSYPLAPYIPMYIVYGSSQGGKQEDRNPNDQCFKSQAA